MHSWADLTAGIGAGHPTLLVCERQERTVVREARKQGGLTTHCLLVVGHEGAAGAPRSTTARRARGEAEQQARLLLKDPNERLDGLSEGTFQHETEVRPGCVQLRVHHTPHPGQQPGGYDRLRVVGSVQFMAPD